MMKFNPMILFLFMAGGSLFFLDGLSLRQAGLTLIFASVLGVFINYMKTRTIRLYKITSILSSFFLAHYVVILLGSSSTLSYLFYLVPITMACLTYHGPGGLLSYGATLFFLFLQFATNHDLTQLLERILIITLFSMGLVYFVGQKQKLYDQNETWLNKLHRKINELSLLKDMTHSMQSAKEQEKLNKIILTAITAGYGLGFNRGVLFLHHEGALQGEYAIGPINKKEAYRIWDSVVTKKITLTEVMSNQDTMDDSLMDHIRRIKLDPVLDKNHPIMKCFLEKKSLLATNGTPKDFGPSMEGLDFEHYGLVPMVSSGESLGVFLVDNRFNEKPINEEDLDTLMTFANQAALAYENIRLYREITTLAITDELTKLYNHRHFKNQIETHLKNHLPFILMVIDVDDFKHFNENFGHKMGDLILSKVGEVLKKASFMKGMAFRYGGDEFTLILPGVSLNEAGQVAKNLQSMVGEASSTLINHSLTVSIGLSSYPEDGGDETMLFIRADQHMKQAKNSGKNSISMEVV